MGVLVAIRGFSGADIEGRCGGEVGGGGSLWVAGEMS